MESQACACHNTGRLVITTPRFRAFRAYHMNKLPNLFTENVRSPTSRCVYLAALFCIHNAFQKSVPHRFACRNLTVALSLWGKQTEQTQTNLWVFVAWISKLGNLMRWSHTWRVRFVQCPAYYLDILNCSNFGPSACTFQRIIWDVAYVMIHWWYGDIAVSVAQQKPICIP